MVTWQQHPSCPVGSTILTYSESSNPASPHFAAQTKLFSQKKWLTDRFCQSQINADPHLQVVTGTGRGAVARQGGGKVPGGRPPGPGPG